MSRYSNEIKLMAMDLAVDDRSDHMLCPFCNGGASNENSMVVTRMLTGLVYFCHRASCHEYGFLPSVGSELVKRKPHRQGAKPYKRETIPLTENQIRAISGVFHIDVDVIRANGWVWNEETARVIMPIHNEHGFIVGHNARYYPWLAPLDKREQNEDMPKAITYWDNLDVPKFEMPVNNSRGGTLVLLEDLTSTLRLSQDIDTLCLLGTHLAPDVVEVLARMNYDTIIISLDADATSKAIKMMKRYKFFFNDMKVVALGGPDVKDMDILEYTYYLRRLDGAQDTSGADAQQGGV